MWSKKLDQYQESYPVRQKELLAIVLAVKKWRHHLLGHPVTVILITKASHEFFTDKPPEVIRVANWIEVLLQFEIRIKYREGS